MSTHNIEPMKYGGNRSDDYVTGWNDCYAAIEADRKRRGELVAAGLRNLLERCREFIDTTTCPAYPAGTDIADDIDAFLAPQPAEPVRCECGPVCQDTGDDCRYAEPVKVPGDDGGET